jgi:N-acetylneuraminic acid mutarotase
MYNDGSRTDLAVVVGERRFEVHGCVLMSGSEFFRTQLQTGVGASSIREVTLPEMSARAFELIVECLYTGVLRSIDASNVMELLEASQRLQAGIAEAQCCDWLVAHLDVFNALVVWESACRIGSEEVQARALAVVGRHLRSVSQQAGFLALPQARLVDLVSADSLAVRSEEEVFEAVMGWVRADIASRKDRIGEVLGPVRLGLLPEPFLADVVGPDPLIEASFEASRLLNQAHACRHTQNADRRATPLRRKRKRPCDVGLMVFGGCAGGPSLATAECYDPAVGQWRVLPEMSVQRYGCAAACIDGFVYVVGGETNGVFEPPTAVASAECYDPSTGRWQALPSMSFMTSGCAAACVEGLLYVVGGEGNGAIPLSSGECYNPSTRQWHAIPDMLVARSGCAAACVEGLLYVVGGEGNGAIPLSSGECYNPSTRQWHAIPDMRVGRSGCAAASMHGLLYVVGGYDGFARLASADCYDPSTEQWRSLSDMSEAMNGCAAACMDELLYVCGGFDGISHLAGAACYDPSKGQWHALPEMNARTSYCAAIHLE